MHGVEPMQGMHKAPVEQLAPARLEGCRQLTKQTANITFPNNSASKCPSCTYSSTTKHHLRQSTAAAPPSFTPGSVTACLAADIFDMANSIKLRQR